jgi:hypothetical protein
VLYSGVTYRDDHDAAIARADSLEREVDELRRERDALQARLALSDASAPDPALTAPLPREVGPLSDPELQTLVDRLAAGMAASRGVNTTLLALALTCAFVGTVAFATFGAWPVALVCGMSCAIFLIFYAVGHRESAAAEWQPVLDAIRDEPDRIVSIKRVPQAVGHALIVSTTGHSLALRSPQSVDLVTLLARRCRHAHLEVE